MRIPPIIWYSVLIGLVLGISLGVHPDKRVWLDEMIQVSASPANPLPIPTSSPDPTLTTVPFTPLPELSNPYTEAQIPSGIYDPKALNSYGIRNCFYGLSDLVPLERPWLQRDKTYRGLTDITRPEVFPELTDYPGLVKIEIIRSKLGSDREHCSAVRVDTHWFLTAAHCFEKENPDRARPLFDVIAVSPALDVLGADTQIEPLKGALCHGEHGVSRYRYTTDVALFFIEDVSAFESVEIATLEHGGQHLTHQDFEKAYISGWGRNGGSRYLQGGAVAISLFGESVLISERIGKRGPDVGDSGAPLYIDYGEGPLVVGLLSQVTQDLESYGETGIYVRVKSIRDWVERVKTVCEVDAEYVC